MNQLTIHDLCVDYLTDDGPFRALHEITLDVAPGERIAVVGESGSGKTTLGMAVGGFLPARSVEVSASAFRLGEQDLSTPSRQRVPARRPGVSMVFQDAMTSLDPVWTVGSQLVEVLIATTGARRRAARRTAEDWLDRVGLADAALVMGKRPYELSGGMRQRVMLALALAGSPELLIADEPTSALDATLGREVMELMTALVVETGASLVVISHDLELCTRYTDRTAVMYGGHLVELNRSADVARQAAHPYTAALTECIPSIATADRDELPSVPPVDPGRAHGANRMVPVAADRPWHLVNEWDPGFVVPAGARDGAVA
jgi:peptide/nickel transport system ATP-binding protein